MRTLLLCFILALQGWSQPQKGPSSFSPITGMNSIVIPVIPSDIADTNAFPTSKQLDSLIFKSKIHRYFFDQSYGQFLYQGKVLPRVRSLTPELNGTTVNFDRFNILSQLGNLTVPGFDTTGYPLVVFVVFSDYQNLGAWAGQSTFMINGKSYTTKALFMPVFIGKQYRNPSSGYYNHITSIFQYGIQRGNSWSSTDREEGDVNNGITDFERTYTHELGHAIGIATHANSRTNGANFDYEPTHSIDSQFQNLDYGNYYCQMGKGQYSMSMNIPYKVLLGWVQPPRLKVIDQYGNYKARIYPNYSSDSIATDSLRGVDIRIPYVYGAAPDFHRNAGFGLEVRRTSFWDSMLVHPNLSENTKGIMITRHDGFTSMLLDMSPQPNFDINGYLIPNINDVVLKPGMSYSDGKVSFSNVIAFADRSYSVNIQVKDPNQITPIAFDEFSLHKINGQQWTLNATVNGSFEFLNPKGQRMAQGKFVKGTNNLSVPIGSWYLQLRTPHSLHIQKL